MNPPGLSYGSASDGLDHHERPSADRRNRVLPWHYQREAAAHVVTGLPSVVAAIRGSTVELSGIVTSVGQSRRAARAALATTGVSVVRNEIHVLHEPDDPRRSMSS